MMAETRMPGAAVVEAEAGMAIGRPPIAATAFTSSPVSIDVWPYAVPVPAMPGPITTMQICVQNVLGRLERRIFVDRLHITAVGMPVRDRAA